MYTSHDRFMWKPKSASSCEIVNLQENMFGETAIVDISLIPDLVSEYAHLIRFQVLSIAKTVQIAG